MSAPPIDTETAPSSTQSKSTGEEFVVVEDFSNQTSSSTEQPSPPISTEESSPPISTKESSSPIVTARKQKIRKKKMNKTLTHPLQQTTTTSHTSFTKDVWATDGVERWKKRLPPAIKKTEGSNKKT